MSKKIILFIGLIICFLSILFVFVYVGTVEKQKINKEEEIAKLALNKVNRLPVAPCNDSAEKEIDWENITPEYFLTEDIFDTDARTGLTKFNTSENEEVDNMFVRRWYDENDIPFITITVMESKDNLPEVRNDAHMKRDIGSTIEISEDRVMTILDRFIFNNEVVEEIKLDVKKEQGIETSFHLNWLENEFSFSIETIFSEYQDDIKKIAKNIINKYKPVE